MINPDNLLAVFQEKTEKEHGATERTEMRP